jgi:hypothetical protein
MTELVFLDPDTREFYADWHRKARAVLATSARSNGAIRLLSRAPRPLDPGQPQHWRCSPTWPTRTRHRL